MNSTTAMKRGNVTLSAAAVCPVTAVLPTGIDSDLSNHQWFGYGLPRREKAAPEVVPT